MPPKKGKKVAGKKDTIDDATEKLYRAYRRALIAGGLRMPKLMMEKFADLRDEKNPKNLNEVILWEDVGPEGISALFHAIRSISYKYVREIRL